MMDEFESSGFEAGRAGKDPQDASLWSQAWGCPGLNLPLYVMAGWVAGRAVKIFNEETNQW